MPFDHPVDMQNHMFQQLTNSLQKHIQEESMSRCQKLIHKISELRPQIPNYVEQLNSLFDQTVAVNALIAAKRNTFRTKLTSSILKEIDSVYDNMDTIENIIERKNSNHKRFTDYQYQSPYFRDNSDNPFSSFSYQLETRSFTDEEWLEIVRKIFECFEHDAEIMQYLLNEYDQMI